MNPKTVFLEDKELVKWWVSIVHDSRFDKVGVLSLASVAVLDPQLVEGARTCLDVMVALPEAPLPEVPFPSPGLVHEMPGRVTLNPDKPKA